MLVKRRSHSYICCYAWLISNGQHIDEIFRGKDVIIQFFYRLLYSWILLYLSLYSSFIITPLSWEKHFILSPRCIPDRSLGHSLKGSMRQSPWRSTRLSKRHSTRLSPKHSPRRFFLEASHEAFPISPFPIQGSKIALLLMVLSHVLKKSYFMTNLRQKFNRKCSLIHLPFKFN